MVISFYRYSSSRDVFYTRKGILNMKNVPSETAIKINIYACRTDLGNVCMQLYSYVDGGHSRGAASRLVGWDRERRVWKMSDPITNEVVEVSEQHVFEELVAAYKNNLTVEDLVTANLERIKEGF